MPKHDACPVNAELDLYTGCTLGCVYCIAGARHASESRPVEGIEQLIEARAGAPFYLSPWTDAYQHLEQETGLCRRVLTALAARGLPFFVITKSCLVARDLELFAGRRDAFVAVSLNTLDDEVTRRLEPGASAASERRELLERLNAGHEVRTVVKIDPVIPGVTDGARLERLLDWLCELRPHAVTLETLRLDAELARRVVNELTRAEAQELQSRYPPLDGEPWHPELAYRMRLFTGAAARLEAAGVRACFCRATLPRAITPHDCRGGY